MYFCSSGQINMITGRIPVKKKIVLAGRRLPFAGFSLPTPVPPIYSHKFLSVQIVKIIFSTLLVQKTNNFYWNYNLFTHIKLSRGDNNYYYTNYNKRRVITNCIFSNWLGNTSSLFYLFPEMIQPLPFQRQKFLQLFELLLISHLETFLRTQPSNQCTVACRSA